MTTRVWITDGSWPVFSDTTRLRAKHPALFSLRTRYEGFVDPAVPRGSASVRTERADDALYVEAEWLVEFPDGIDRYLQEPGLVDAATEITVQGMIEGKWMNRLLGTTAWRPASMGNSLIAAGPGLATSVGALEWGEGGSMRLSYRTAGGALRTQQASVADLRGHNAVGLVREVLRACARDGMGLDAINLGAVGEARCGRQRAGAVQGRRTPVRTLREGEARSRRPRRAPRRAARKLGRDGRRRRSRQGRRRGRADARVCLANER